MTKKTTTKKPVLGMAFEAAPRPAVAKKPKAPVGLAALFGKPVSAASSKKKKC